MDHNSHPTPMFADGSQDADGARAEERAVSEVLDVLADHHRRSIVDHLQAADGNTATIGELADRCRSERIGDGEAMYVAERIEARLHHAHLPKLQDAGVVEFDASAGSVRYLGDPLLEEFLDRVREREQ